MKKKNTTDQDIDEAKQSKAEPKAVAQPSREERFNKIKADHKAKEEAREKKIEKLIDDEIEKGTSDSEIQKMIKAYFDYGDAFFLNESLKKSEK
jgi:hypothetical protein